MNILRRRFALAAFCLGASACAGVNTPSDVIGASPITIEVIGINSARSFSPNPESIPAGQMVVWHNGTIETHHVVPDDRSVDTGNLRPGAWSAPMPIGTAGPYHCTIHPSMVGTISR